MTSRERMRALVLAALVLAGPAVIGRAGPLDSLQDSASGGASLAAARFDGMAPQAGVLQLEPETPLAKPAPAPKLSEPARDFSGNKLLGIPDIGGAPAKTPLDTARKAALTVGILAAVASSILVFFNPVFFFLMAVAVGLIVLADHLPTSQS